MADRIALLIDGENLHHTARSLGFEIDFKRLLQDALSPDPAFRTVIVYELSRFSRDEPMRAMARAMRWHISK